jgi:hypothetical protein
MFDNMTGAVGFAMHDDRLARATKNLRLFEAEQATKTPRTNTRRPSRERVARALMALAVRLDASLAVSATMASGQTVATAR